MTEFSESIHVARFSNAAFFCTDLFREAFAAPFPIPRDNCGLSFPTPPQNWSQYVAFYKHSDQHIEPVAFGNWLRFKDTYLEGGLCARRNFYRRLPAVHWKACKDRGGIVQILLEEVAKQLVDCTAWFGYCGDKKSLQVNLRVGYVPTTHRYLIVKWFRDIDEGSRADLIDDIAKLGPF